MIGAGVVSASWGYALGREALKGVSQPDARPSSQPSSPRGNAPRRDEVLILPEEDILEDVRSRMSGEARSEAPSNGNKALGADLPSDPNQAATLVSNAEAGFPIVGSDQNVTLEVRSTRQQGSSLVLDVSLQNAGSRPVKFLYSFMNITDNQGRAFSANTEGLPGELPADSQAFSGVVSIPIALLDDSENLSLSLTDYPDQQLQLQLSDIPVVR